MVWRATWSYLPTLVMLQYRREVVDVLCPRCRNFPKTLMHSLRDCSVFVYVWKELDLEWILTYYNQDQHGASKSLLLFVMANMVL